VIRSPIFAVTPILHCLHSNIFAIMGCARCFPARRSEQPLSSAQVRLALVLVRGREDADCDLYKCHRLALGIVPRPAVSWASLAVTRSRQVCARTMNEMASASLRTATHYRSHPLFHPATITSIQ